MRPVEARIGLFGSFAETGQGHGTDRALVAGLLGMKPDDLEIPHSFSLAEERGLRFSFYTANLREAHPNTAVLEVRDAAGRTLTLQGGIHRRRENPGGPAQRCGRQLYRNVQHSGSAASGYCRKGGGCDPALSSAKINIANMSVCRDRRGGDALMVIETDQKVPPVVRVLIGELRGIRSLTYYEKEE